LTWS